MNQPKFKVPTRASGLPAPPPSDEDVQRFAAGAAMVVSQAGEPAALAAPAAQPSDAAPVPAAPRIALADRPAKPIRLNVDIDPVKYQRLRHLASAKGVKLTGLVRSMIDRELG